MDSKKRSFLLVFFAVMGIRMSLLAQTLHLIAFCDTDDSRIGQATEVSYKYFAREFKELITNSAGMSVKTYFYKGSAFTLPNLDALLNTLSVGQDDAILFWYDGHGFNNQDGDFPTLTLPNLQNVRSLQSISTSLRNKGARLTCVFANACNKERTTRANTVGTFIAQNAPDAYASERIRLLFKSRGSLIATSSKRGQASQNTPSGAWYFLGFRGALDEMFSNSYDGAVNWNALMASVSQKTEKIGEDNGFTQNPKYESAISVGTSYTTETPKREDEIVASELKKAHDFCTSKNYSDAFQIFYKYQNHSLFNKEYARRLGYLYDKGHGVTQDYTEAVKWYRKAAEQGDAVAQNNLGWMYKSGLGTSQSDYDAIKWYQLAIEQGNIYAHVNLGWMYENGRGTSENYSEAARLYLKAALLGDDGGQNNLGSLYRNGHGVSQNYAEALKWYRKAAEQGNAYAYANLGYMYEKGYGVAVNRAEAINWYEKSALQGNTFAKEKLINLRGY